MRDLMRDQPAQQMWWRQNDPPVVTDRSAGRAAAPSAAGIPDAHRPDRHTGLCRHFRGDMAQTVAGFGSKEAFDPSGEGLKRPPTFQPAISEAWRPCRSFCPVKDDLATFKRYHSARHKGFGRLNPSERWIQPG